VAVRAVAVVAVAVRAVAVVAVAVRAVAVVAVAVVAVAVVAVAVRAVAEVEEEARGRRRGSERRLLASSFSAARQAWSRPRWFVAACRASSRM
jgi:hypothetical protein